MMATTGSKLPILCVAALAVGFAALTIARGIEPRAPAPDLAGFGAVLATLLFASGILARTRKAALPIAVGVGLAVSCIGLRGLNPLFKSAPQEPWFVAVDVILTGLLLAGGSDGIHWLVALYRDWIDKNRSTKS